MSKGWIKTFIAIQKRTSRVAELSDFTNFLEVRLKLTIFKASDCLPIKTAQHVQTAKNQIATFLAISFLIFVLFKDLISSC